MDRSRHSNAAEYQAESGQQQVAWRVTLVASLFFFYQFLQISMFNSLNEFIQADLHLSLSQLGYLSSSYFFASLLSLIPAGIVLDHYSTRNTITYAIGGSAILLFILAQTDSLLVACVVRFLSGICGAFCFLSPVRLASRWFSSSELAFVVGIIVAVGLFGGVVAQSPILHLIYLFNWRITLWIIASVGLFLALLVRLFVIDYPKGISPSSTVKHFSNYFESFTRVISTWRNWLVGLYISLMNIPILVLGAMWGDRYITSAYHVNGFVAAEACSMLFWGMIIGSPIIGRLSDKFHSRTEIMLLTACGLTLLYGLLLTTFTHNIVFICMLLFLIGAFSSGQILGYPYIAEINPSKYTATAEGLASMIMISGGLLQSLFGWLVEFASNVNVMTNTLNASTYRYAILILPVTSAIALLTTLFLKRTEK